MDPFSALLLAVALVSGTLLVVGMAVSIRDARRRRLALEAAAATPTMAHIGEVAIGDVHRLPFDVATVIEDELRRGAR